MKLSPSVVLRVCLLLLLVAVAAGLAGNLSVIRRPLMTAGNPVHSAEAPLRLLVLAPVQDNPFWDQVYAGARQAAERLHLTVELNGPRHAAVEEQAQLLDMATAAQVDGIITQGVADARLTAALVKAAERGIPVVTVETDVPQGAGRRLAYIGPDNYQAGRVAAEELVLRTGGKAVVGVVRGHLGAEADDLRVKGFRDGLAGAPGVRIVAVESSELNRNVAGQRALAILREHADVTALYATTAFDAVGVAQAVTALGRRGGPLVFAWGSTGEWDDPTLRGVVQVAVVQDPTSMGRRAVEVLEAYLRRDIRPTPSIYIPVTIRSGGGAW